MDKKITIQEFAGLISEKRPEIDSTEVEAVLKNLFSDASLQLQNTGEAFIPGIGIFKKMSPENGYVALEVDNELSAAVNAPFEAFSVVELDEDYREEHFNEEVTVVNDNESCEAGESVKDMEQDQDASAEVSNLIEETTSAEGIVSTEETVTAEDTDEASESAHVISPPVPESVTVDAAETPPPFNVTTAYSKSSQYAIEPIEEEYVDENYATSPGKKFANGLICGIVICIALAAIGAVIYSVCF